MLLYRSPPKCHKDHFHHALRRIENFGLYKWKQNCMVHRISKWSSQMMNPHENMKHIEGFHFNKPTCVGSLPQVLSFLAHQNGEVPNL